ncbi:MAG: hypothetical protein K6A63_08550 [Acholeplasmatales bacterium]|nr:hypothetical protein [Acholeplasmatales bacterium]
MNKNKKVTFITFVIIGFIILCLGGLSTIVGAAIKENRLIYLGLTFLIIGFVLYIILFGVLLFWAKKYFTEDEKKDEEKKLDSDFGDQDK